MAAVLNESVTMDISDFDFTLPEKLIAQHPPEVRGSSRLLVALPDMPLQDRVFGRFARLCRRGRRFGIQ